MTERLEPAYLPDLGYPNLMSDVGAGGTRAPPKKQLGVGMGVIDYR